MPNRHGHELADCPGDDHCCLDHPEDKPWGWNSAAWQRHWTESDQHRAVIHLKSRESKDA